jgi:hypothetical protein
LAAAATFDAGNAEQNLPLQVAGTDDIHIGQPDGPDARGRQVEADRTTQSACADAKDFGTQKLELSLDADFGQQQVAFVPVDLFGIELGWHEKTLGVCERGVKGGDLRGAGPCRAPEVSALSWNTEPSPRPSP